MLRTDRHLFERKALLKGVLVVISLMPFPRLQGLDHCLDLQTALTTYASHLFTLLAKMTTLFFSLGVLYYAQSRN